MENLNVNTIMEHSQEILRHLDSLINADEDTVAGLVCGELDDKTAAELQAGFDVIADFRREKDLMKSTGIPSMRFVQYAPLLELLEDETLQARYDFYLQQKTMMNDIRTEDMVAAMLKLRNTGRNELLAASGQSGDAIARQVPQKMRFHSDDGKIKLSLDIVSNRFEFLLEASDQETRQILAQNCRLHLGVFPVVELDDGFGELEINSEENRIVPITLELNNGSTITLTADI